MGTEMTAPATASHSEVQEAVLTGHAHPDYARAFGEFGTPRELPRCGGWVLEREISGTEYRDAMGCYPLFACQNWSHLKEDLDALGKDLVSVAMVPDPLSAYDLSDLEAAFDFVKPFKEHVVIDLTGPWQSAVTRHHRLEVRRAFKVIEVKRCANSQDYLDDWVRLYGHLVDRHGITGLRAFSRRSLSLQLDVPGASFLVAIHQDVVVGALLLYRYGDVAYVHLTAVDDVGYRLGASYALWWTAMEYCADKTHWFNLSGVPGVDEKGGEGLRWFKQGWSRETRTSYFCGRIFDSEAYDLLTRTKGASPEPYFPSYRAGEFK